MEAIKIEEHVVYYQGKKIEDYNEVAVIFKDGSMANVETGEIVNKGEGTIEIKPISHIILQPTTIDEFAFAKKVVVVGLPASLVVENHDKPDINIHIEGPRGIVRNIDTTKWEEDVLQISYYSGNDWLNGIGLTVKDIINPPNPLSQFPQEDMYAQAAVTLKVPRDTEVEITNPLGMVSIGEVDGKIFLRCCGNKYVQMKSVKDVAVELSGSAHLKIDHIEGKASFVLYGTSSVSLQDGMITNLNLVSHSKVDTSIRADIKSGQVKMTNCGEIFLNNKPVKKQTF